jgi:hypothetical protein
LYKIKSLLLEVKRELNKIPLMDINIERIELGNGLKRFLIYIKDELP